MANTFYDPGARRAAKVKDLFAVIARRYDLINDLQSFGLHRRWKRKVVRMARVRHGDRVLDLCCGTGDLACGTAAQGADVIALDFSEAMLQVGRARRRKACLRSGPKHMGPGIAVRAAESEHLLPRLSFVQGDAELLPFRDNSFDVVTVGYGLRNLADWRKGLTEMARVARPGARLLVLDFAKPDNALWRSLYFGYLRLFVPLLGRVFCGNADAYAYILESLAHYPAQHGVAAQMRELGLARVEIISLLGGVMSVNYGERT